MSLLDVNPRTCMSPFMASRNGRYPIASQSLSKMAYRLSEGTLLSLQTPNIITRIRQASDVLFDCILTSDDVNKRCG